MDTTVNQQKGVAALEIGQVVQLKCMEGDQWNRFTVYRQDINGTFYVRQDKEYACGDSPVTEDQILANIGWAYNVPHMIKQNEVWLENARKQIE